MKSCAVTGHRPTRFKWKYNENNAGCRRLKKRLYAQFALLYDMGVRGFFLGGALGVDLWAGEELLRLKSNPAYSELSLHLALPFDGYDDKWDADSKRRMTALRNACASIVTVGLPSDPAVAYKRRNYHMVDHSDYLIAVYDNDRSIRSGTGMTVNYAKKKGLQIIYIHPDTGAVTGDMPE